jgi:hypothetical protein
MTARAIKCGISQTHYSLPNTTLNYFKEMLMGACTCGYTTDPEKNCNGTHNVVKAVKADMIAKLEAEGFADAAEALKAK